MCKTQIQEFSEDFSLLFYQEQKSQLHLNNPYLVETRNDLTIIFITFMFFAAKALFMERNNTAI